MICTNCKQIVPDGKLSCPHCAEERSRAALFEYQLHPLRLISEGKGTLTTRNIEGTRHAQMAGAARTFCNLPVESYHRRSWIALADFMESETVCRICQERITTLLEKIAIAAA